MPTLHFISGGGLSGSLVNDEGAWLYVSNDPAPVVADYDVISREWTIQSGRLTTVLEPSSPSDGYAGWDADGLEPIRWRVRHVEDVDGNAMEYLWDGPYLDEIHYGHCVGDGCTATYNLLDPDPYFQVVFNYSNAVMPNKTVDVRQGFKETIAEHLNSVEVFARVDPLQSAEQVARYNFYYGILGNGQYVL